MTDRKYSLEHFHELNRAAEEAPLVPAPPVQDAVGFEEVARRRIATLSRFVDVEGRDVLELGTGRGYTAAQLVASARAKSVVGIDVRTYPDWEKHDPKTVRFIVGDLASKPLVEPESIDVVVSAVVFEHVTRPIRMLEALYNALRPGGTAWLYFNLYRGPKASHRYRVITFPWPHLLFDDDQSEVLIRELGSKGKFAWVNRMTAAEYLQVCAELGFEITAYQRHIARLQDHVDFYIEHEDILGRYPALDLETDFLTIALRKRAEPNMVVPKLDYLRRQQVFDRMVLLRQRELRAQKSAAT